MKKTLLFILPPLMILIIAVLNTFFIKYCSFLMGLINLKPTNKQ